MRKKTVFLLVFVLVLASISAYFILPIFLPAAPPTETEVCLNFHSSSTKAPIKGLAVDFSMTTRWQDAFLISGVSDENGRILQILPTNDIAFPVSAANISISGIWVLQKTVGEETKVISDQNWVALSPQAFISNSSEYTFDKVSLHHERDGSKLSLGLDFYLTAGKLISIYDPIPEARRLDYHLRISLLNCNYVKFQEGSYAAVPVAEPLILDLGADYLIYQGQPLHWEVHISVDTGNRPFIDLTLPLTRAVSSGQVKELTRILDNLKPYGFELADHYNKLDQILNAYDLATLKLEDGDYSAFRIHVQSAMHLYRDLYAEIAGTYIDGLVWIPNLILVFLFFSLSLSNLITDRKAHSIASFVILFSIVFCLFVFTQPYLRLFVSNPSVLIQSFTLSSALQLSLQLLPIIFLLLISFFAQIKSFLWETFVVGMRNLRRRKLKTVLALTTVLVISASAMCFLTITAEKPVFQRTYVGIKPTVDRGLVIFKTLTQVPFDRKDPMVYLHLPIQQYEIEWFSEHEWIEAMNIYALRKVNFARADGFINEGFSTFNLVVVNASFMDHYQNVSDVLGIEWFDDIDKDMVILGSRIAEVYDLETGSEVLINDRKFVVKSIVEEEKVVEKLRDIDGDLFLFMVYDPVTKKIDGESFIFGTLSDFSDGGVLANRISIVLRSEYAQNATQIAGDLQGFGYDFGRTEDYSYVTTYLVHAIVSNSVYIVYSEFPSTTISGLWQAQIVPMIIATLVLVANTMGTVAERKSEVRTIHIIGASPLRVSLVFITEGLVLGIVGGIFGYVFGYLLVQYANIALPALVKENIVGGAPFAIAMSTATLASLLGCLFPSREAMRMVVPSGRLRQRPKEIMKIHEGKAHLKVPLKVDGTERSVFRRFLDALANEYLYPIYISQPYMKEIREETLYEVTVRSHVSDEIASFLVSILAKPNENLEVTAQPIEDVETKKICEWDRKHKDNINELARILRKEILKFTEFKDKG